MFAPFLTAAVSAATAAAPPLPSNPDSSQLPGAQTLSDLANGIDGWALIAAVLGIVIGGVLWAFGHYSQNFQQAYNGRRGVMVSGLAALLVGAAPNVVGFFLAQGRGLH